MTETQASVSEWAAATFGPPSTHARVAGRMIEECAELVREATARCRPEAIAGECADVAIVLLRLGVRLGVAVNMVERGDDSGQRMARNLSTPTVVLAIEAMRRCCGLLDVASILDEHPHMLEESSAFTARSAAIGLADALECLCRQAGTTLQAEVDRKMAVNRAREWKLTGDGHGHHLRDKEDLSVLADVQDPELDMKCRLPRGAVALRDVTRAEAIRLVVGLGRQVKGIHADALFRAVDEHREREATAAEAEDVPSPIKMAVGDLGPARRHVDRLLRGQLPPSTMVFQEIDNCLQRCVERLEGMERT